MRMRGDKPAQRVAPVLICGLLMGNIVVLAGCYGSPQPLPPRPLAQAGIDTFGRVGDAVALDGSLSTSPSELPLSYAWAFATRPTGSLLLETDISPNGSEDAAQARFTPDRPGRYVVQLLVSDAKNISLGDFVVVDVEGAIQPPLADAGPDQVLEQGMVAYLDGTGSAHPSGAELYYRWTLAGVPELSSLTQRDVDNPYTPYPSLRLDTGGVFTLALEVTDGASTSEPDYVFLTAESINSPPLADAGSDQTVQVCLWTTLDGSSSSDLNADPLAFAWEVLVTPLYSAVSTQTLEGAESPVVSLYPDIPGTYALALTVRDGAASSVPDVVALTTVARLANTPPKAEAGDPLLVNNSVVCSTTGGYCPECPIMTVALDGGLSSDPDNDRLSYLWSPSDDTQGALLITHADQQWAEAELRGAKTAVGATVITTFRVRLQVTDCPGAVAEDTVEIRYSCTGGS